MKNAPQYFYLDMNFQEGLQFSSSINPSPLTFEILLSVAQSSTFSYTFNKFRIYIHFNK